MRYRKIIYIVLFCLTTLISQAQIHDKVSINLADFKSEKVQEFDKVMWKSDFKTNETGLPELPVYRVSYVLPIHAKFTGVSFSKKEKQLLEKDIYIYPVQPPIPLDNSKPIDFRQPDEKTYNSDEPYPGTLYKLESDDIYQGYHIVTLQIFPFEYMPKSRKLHYYPDLEYTVEYDNVSTDTIIISEKQTITRAELCKKAAMNIVKNKQDVESFGSNVISTNKTKKTIKSGMQKTKSLSIDDDITPDYIIITSNSLKSAFKPLADWKTQKGLFTIIKTTEEIEASFIGNDLQEKIRKYLIYAYGKWGPNIYVLLGGNISIIPSRFVFGDSDNKYYPTDKYYSTSVTWPAYSAQFAGNDTKTLFNYVGRIPVSNSTEINLYVNKLIHYEKADTLGDGDLNYLKNNLYANAYMVLNGDGSLSNFWQKDIKSYVEANVPKTISKTFMCDNANCTGNSIKYLSNTLTNHNTCGNGNVNGNIEFNKENFLSCLNSGSSLVDGKFHFIFHKDHSGETGMGTSGIDKGEGIGISDMENLSNGNSYQILLSNGCHPANFQYNCMGTRYILNAQGGVAFIGNTDVGWDDEYGQLNGFLQSIYQSGRYDIGNAFQNALLNYSYFSSWKLHLLGDPEMQVWTDKPTNLTVLLSSTAVSIGQRTDSVTVSGLPNGTTGRICFWKGTEVYVIQENVTNGTYPISFTANTPGEIKVTVTAHNFKPSESIITVNSNSNPNLSVSTVDFGDGIVTSLGDGNANGLNDAGEKINLTLGIKNTGVNSANNVTATLSCSSSYITITSNQGSLGNIASGATATSNQFNYTIDKDAPEVLSNSSSPVQFIVTMTDGNNTTWTHKFNIDVFNDVLAQCNKTIVSTTNEDKIPQAGETVTMNIALQNLGKNQIKGLTAILTSTNSNCTINSGNTTYATMAPLDVKNGNATFSFKTNTSTLSQMAFNLSVTNAYTKIWNFPFTLAQPTEITASLFNFTAAETEINLFWKLVSGVSGYNIYRCDVDVNTGLPTGNYVKLNTVPFQLSYYNDLGLQKNTKYSYKVTTISSTGNESNGVTMIVWTSYPSKNLYPRQMDESIGSFHTPINVGDINNDGKKEIFAGISGGTYQGGLVCLDYYGNEPFNIDNDATTYSGFVQLGYSTSAIPAIGDLKKTGISSVLEPTRNYQQDNKIFCYSAEDKSPVDGKPDLLWSNLTPQKQYLNGVVLSNIDNSTDGSMEIVTCSDERGSISTYNADGTLRTDIACVNTYAPIAVADLDGSGAKEIIQTSGTSINVWHSDGSFHKGSSAAIYNIPSTLNGYRFVGSVVVCDIDNNSSNGKEILTFAIKQQANGNTASSAILFAIHNDGTLVSGFGGTNTISTICDWNQNLSVGDLINNDGYLEIVTFSLAGIKIWDHTGALIKTIAYPLACRDHPVGKTPILADIDQDHSDVEILFGSANKIYAFKLSGTIPFGFPLRTKEFNVNSIAVSDVDNDGKNEVVSAGESYMDMWQTVGSPSKIEWGSERHDQYNTGEYQTICDPSIITSNATWNANQSVCGDLIVKSGTLTINSSSTLTMGNSSMIIVMAGASLVIDSGSILNANIRALAGSNVTLKNNGSIKLRANAEFYTELTTIVDMQYGSIDK